MSAAASQAPRRSLPAKLWAWLRFSVFYLKEIVVSNLMITRDVLTPKDYTEPGVLAIELPEDMSDSQIMMVSNLITMTPGTLSLDLTEDRRTLFIHILYLHDIEGTRHHLQVNYVDRIRQLV